MQSESIKVTFMPSFGLILPAANEVPALLDSKMKE